MINRAAIIQWREHAPWSDNAQVEQDLIISRALVAIFSDDFLSSQLAFRGGTALHKLYLSPQPRYSEDIDLVQIKSGPIKQIMYRLGEVLDFLPDRVTAQKRYNNTMSFRTQSEIPPEIPIKIKLEINCVEHFNVMGLYKIPFAVDNLWYNGSCNITTYKLCELLGTKLRALYQRKKGRDLFDLYIALKDSDVVPQEIVNCYNKYISSSVSNPPTYKQFIANMEQKMEDDDFLNDTVGLLRPDLIDYKPVEAFRLIKSELIDRIPLHT